MQQQETAALHWGSALLLGDGTAWATLLEKNSSAVPCVHCSKEQAVLRLCRATALWVGKGGRRGRADLGGPECSEFRVMCVLCRLQGSVSTWLCAQSGSCTLYGSFFTVKASALEFM